MTEMGNLNTCLGVTLAYFHNAEVSNLLEKIRDPMAIMIKVVGLIAECFSFLRKFLGFLIF
jgi:hypothetical protein